jgi:polar amino acid transport system permease protein
MEILLKGRNLSRLLFGLWVALRIALISMLLSVCIGIPLGLLMTLRNPAARILSRLYLEFSRLMPQLVLLFLAYFGLTRVFGVNLSGEAAAILAFTVWGSAEMGDLVRGAVTSIPGHQYESAYALGLNKLAAYAYIILPQSVRRLMPPAVNLVTRMVKTTSLITLIGVVEVLKVGQQIIEANRYEEPRLALFMYAVIFLLYFAACYPISQLSKWLERRMRV